MVEYQGPKSIDRVCFSRDLFMCNGTPVWTHCYPHVGAIELHEHDFLEIVLVLSGSCEHLTVHGSQPIAAGDLLILQPGQWHGYTDAPKMLIHNCCLSVELFSRELQWVHDDRRLAPLFPQRLARNDHERRMAHQGVLVLHYEGTALRRLSAAYTALDRCANSATAAERRGELIAKVLLLLEAIASHDELRAPRTTVDPRITAVQAAMVTDLARPWALDELAALAGTSASHLLRVFRAHTGLAPIAWLARQRADRLAVRLRSTDLPVATLGPEVGWDDPSYCARRFRACFGKAPDAYRRSG